MRTRTTSGLPARLERPRGRFDCWRRTREGRSRIPAGLWTAAVKAAGEYGLCRTARALGLDYYSLKKRSEFAALHSPSEAEGNHCLRQRSNPGCGDVGLQEEQMFSRCQCQVKQQFSSPRLKTNTPI